MLFSLIDPSQHCDFIGCMKTLVQSYTINNGSGTQDAAKRQRGNAVVNHRFSNGSGTVPES